MEALEKEVAIKRKNKPNGCISLHSFVGRE
jgi:hypothetical protein